MTSLFKLFIVFLKAIEIYLFEPIFYLVVFIFASGLHNIKSAKEGNLFTTKKRLIIDGISMIVISIFIFWWYWLRIGNLGLIRI